VNHIPFVGRGHFIFLAVVNSQMKELYGEYFSTLKPEQFGMPVSNTSYNAAFSSPSCTEFWDKDTKDDDEHFYDACAAAPRVGRLSALT
jgi:hypothetical protein